MGAENPSASAAPGGCALLSQPAPVPEVVRIRTTAFPLEDTSPDTPPQRIQVDGFLLRAWRPDDAERLQEALTRSRIELEAWTPWVLQGADDVEALRTRLAGYATDFQAGEDSLFALMEPDESAVLGGVGLYRRVGPDALEIGYWIRSDRAGQGLATAASRALTDVAFALPGIERVEIHCRVDHRASIRIAEKLGYRCREVVAGTPARPGDTEIWEVERAAWASGPDIVRPPVAKQP